MDKSLADRIEALAANYAIFHDSDFDAILADVRELERCVRLARDATINFSAERSSAGYEGSPLRVAHEACAAILTKTGAIKGDV